MNVIHFSPHFPPNYYLFTKALKKAGANVLGLGDEEYHHLHPELQSTLQEYYKVSNLHHYDELIRALGFFTYKYGKIHRIESHTEYWIETEAKLRDDFNIFGIRSHELDHIKRKSHMKQAFKELGIPVVRGTVIPTQEQAKQFIQEVGYPVIAKPDMGVGAANTYKITSGEDLEHFFRTKPTVEYIMEEFIQGTIHSFDGLTDRYGNLVFYTAHVFSQGIMETVNEDQNIYYYSMINIPAQLEEMGRKCIKAFNVKERFFHFEFFAQENNDYIALEVNLRPPGGTTTDMMNYAHEFDIYQIWADLVVHNRSDFVYDRKYHTCYLGRKNNRAYQYSHQDILKRYPVAIVHHNPMASSYSKVLGEYGYIFRSYDFNEIQTIIQDLYR